LLGVRRVTSLTVPILAGLLAGIGGSAHAQTPGNFERQRRAAERDAAPAAAPGDSILRVERIVTFEDVLAAPDDIDLNFAYAQAQIARGDARGATATLERILLIEPDLPRVRLLYAIVLFRLDQLDEAEREFQTLRGLDMPESLRAELDRYTREARLRRQATRTTVTLSFGQFWDSNVNSAPRRGQSLVSDLELKLDESSLRTSDFGSQTLVRIDTAYDPGYQSRHRWLLGARYLREDYQRMERYTPQLGGLDGGIALDLASFTLTPALYANHYRIAKQQAVNSAGLRFKLDYAFTGATQFYGFQEFERQLYYPIALSDVAADDTGMQYSTGLGAASQYRPDMRVSVEIARTRKVAKYGYRSSWGHSLTLGHTWLLGGGAFFQLEGYWRVDNYDSGDPTISENTRRRDRPLEGRALLGVPVALALDPGGVSDVLRDLTFTAAARLARNGSNLVNYEYHRDRYSVALVKRIEF
jgi:tetratricopeptide (TPR) repeat protein